MRNSRAKDGHNQAVENNGQEFLLHSCVWIVWFPRRQVKVPEKNFNCLFLNLVEIKSIPWNFLFI